MKQIILAIILTFSQVSHANCPEDIQVIEQGQVANCDGLLFSPEAAKKVDENQQDAKYYKELSGQLYESRNLYIEQVDTMDKRLKLYMDQSHTLAQEVTRKENEDKWQKFLYFGLGVLATGVAIYGASELSR